MSALIHTKKRFWRNFALSAVFTAIIVILWWRQLGQAKPSLPHWIIGTIFQLLDVILGYCLSLIGLKYSNSRCAPIVRFLKKVALVRF